VLQKVFDVRQTLLTADYAPWMTERLSTGAVHDGNWDKEEACRFLILI